MSFAIDSISQNLSSFRQTFLAGAPTAAEGDGEGDGAAAPTLSGTFQSFQASSFSVSLGSNGFSVSQTSVSILTAELSGNVNGLQLGNTPETEVDTQPTTFEEVTNRVLGFVENRLQTEQDNGASEEELGSLLDQAREGVAVGFDQAREQIEALDLLNENLASTIDNTEDAIEVGLDDLEESFVPSRSDRDEDVIAAIQPREVSAPVTATEQDDVDDDVDDADDTPEVSPINIPNGARFDSTRLDALVETAGIEVITQDGDRVTIFLEQIQASLQQSQGGFATPNRFAGGDFEATALAASNFTFSVEGELDEGEISALNDLVAQVEGLADAFFQGDVQSAFARALELDFNQDELSAFTINLTQTSVQAVSEAFLPGNNGQGNANGLNNPFSNAIRQFQPLANFISQVVSTLELSAGFEEGRDLSATLFDQVVETRLAQQQEPNPAAFDDARALAQQIFELA